MKTYNIKVFFDIRQQVYRKCDPDKYMYIVVAFIVDEKDILYKITGISGDFYCYHFEIEDYNNRHAELN